MNIMNHVVTLSIHTFFVFVMFVCLVWTNNKFKLKIEKSKLTEYCICSYLFYSFIYDFFVRKSGFLDIDYVIIAIIIFTLMIKPRIRSL